MRLREMLDILAHNPIHVRATNLRTLPAGFIFRSSWLGWQLADLVAVLTLPPLVGPLSVFADDKEKEKPMKAIMVHYTGNVQGVGFRATAEMIAKDYPVVGWVKNLSDGRVRLSAEGPADSGEKLLRAARQH